MSEDIVFCVCNVIYETSSMLKAATEAPFLESNSITLGLCCLC